MQQVMEVSPLVQIMQELVKDLVSKGIKAARISESSDIDRQIIEGRYEVIFGNAEEWHLPNWKAYFLLKIYKTLPLLLLTRFTLW